MSKHAYLIIAHSNVGLLNQLLSVLDDDHNDIFLHIDKKADAKFISSIHQNLLKSRLYFSKRVTVHWGGYSQILSELELLKAATKRGHYDYYHLLSGVDLPIKSQDYIHQFFDLNQGKEFVQFQKPVIAKQKLERLRRYYMFQEHDIRNSPILSLTQRATVKLQRIAHLDRIHKSHITFQMGSNWFSITDQLARYVLSQAPHYLPLFKYSQCADELFLQTVVANSSFLSNVFDQHFNDSEVGNMRFIKWVNHAPRIITSEDFPALKSSSLLFARKFDPIRDQKIIDQVVAELAI